MATFEAQVEGLTSLAIDGSSAPTQTELTQFLTDGAKDIINQMPSTLIDLCAAQQTFTSVAPGSEAETINTGKILNVFRNDGDIDQPCRKISNKNKGRAIDSDDMSYASITDPVYYVENNKINSLPAGGSCKYSEVQYPAVAFGDSAISVFPDEAEYLVPLYASVKALQNVLGNKSSNSDITTALTAAKTELNETQDVCDKIDADLVLAKAEVVLAKAEAAEMATQTDNSGNFETACDAMATELNKTDDIITLAKDEFDEVATQVSGSKDSPITDAFTQFELVAAQLAQGETDTEGAVNTATAKIITELDETQVVCDLINSQVDSSVTALGNMATEIALANQEVDDALTEIAEAIGLVDNASNIQVAVDGMKTANAKFRADGSDPALFGDESTYTTGSSAMTNVKTYVDRAISYINGNFPDAAYDLAANLSDVDAGLTAEDIELANGRMQQVQTTLNTMKADLDIAQTYITEWNTMVNTLVSEVNAFSSEASSRFGWIKAKADVWNGELASAQGYMSTANGYASQANGFNSSAKGYATEVQTKINIANGYIAEVNVRLQQAKAKRDEAQSRISAGSAYLQEAQGIIQAGNAYIQEAQARIGQAQGYAAEVNARGAFTSAKSKAVQGHISTAQAYVATAKGFGDEIQAKVQIAQGYGNEVQLRLSVDTAQYGWLEKQQAKLQADYDKGLQALR